MLFITTAQTISQFIATLALPAVLAVPVQPVTLLVPSVQVQTVQVAFDRNAPYPFSAPDYQAIDFDIADSRDQIAVKTAAAATVAAKQAAQRVETAAQSRTAIGRAEGPSFAQKRSIVQSIAARYNIDWKILESVWQVETGKSWDTGISSYAGATGPMQFMPGTFLHWAQDGNGDGQTDIYNAQDALASAANMLAQSGLNRGDIRSALFSYNHADWYVAKVISIADSIN